MTAVTRILENLEAGDPSAARDLLPLVYDELRRLAADRMKAERGDHTLQATALVHEAFVRLVDPSKADHWNSRGHFFGAAAEAMRRILVENARARHRQKRVGDRKRLDVECAADTNDPAFVLAIHDALEVLAGEDQQLADLVKLRVFAGFSLREVAEMLNLGQSTAYEHWSYAKSRLRILMNESVAD